MKTPMFKDPVSRMYLQSKQRFDALSEISRKGSAGLASLGELRALGQRVTHDDMLRHTVNLLQNGHVTAPEAAKVLSEVPHDGPALAEWVQRQHDMVAGHMQQIGQAHEQARQQLAQSSLNHVLTSIANGGVGG